MEPETSTRARTLRIAGLMTLAAVLVLDLFAPHEAHFEHLGITIDSLPWFFPIFGFLSTVLLVITAKTLAIALARKDTYYAGD